MKRLQNIDPINRYFLLLQKTKKHHLLVTFRKDLLNLKDRKV